MNNAKIATLGTIFVLALALAGGVGVSGALISIKNISNVRATWEAFELGRSEKARALGAIRKEFGYGGMIHQFKNYVLRQDRERIDVVNAKLGGIKAAIARYAALDLTAEETVALGGINAVVEEYARKLGITTILIGRGETSREIDRLVRIDDRPAIDGLGVLERYAERRSEASEVAIGKPQILTMLRKSLGYGGMIHHFKNYILRQDQAGLALTKKHIDVAEHALALYSQQPHGAVEGEAIAEISKVIQAYVKALQVAAAMVKKGGLPNTIDKAVVVDDALALRSFDVLSREIVSESEREARNVQRSLAIVANISKAMAWGTGIIIVILVVASVWMFRSRIVGPISDMTNAMTKLAGGDLDQSIEGMKGNNEIGAMASAVAVFKANAQALLEARDELEQLVLERTKALLDSEQRFRDFATTASDWYWEVDAERRYTFVSDSIRQVVKRPGDWYLGKTVDEIVERFFSRSDWAPFFEAFEARQPYRNLIIERSEGDTHQWIQSSGVPFFAEDGAFLGYRATSTDVTEGMRAKTASRESEIRFQDYATLSADWFFEVDADLRYTYLSETGSVDGVTAENFVGRTRNEILGQTFDPATADDELIAWHQRKPYRNVERRSDLDRNTWLRLSGQPIHANDGTFLGFRGTSTNITAQKKFENSIHENEAQVRLLLASSPMGVVVVNHEREGDQIVARRIFANQALADTFGWASLEALIKGDVSDSWFEPDQLQLANGIMNSGQDLNDFEARRRRADGSELWISMNSRQIKYDGQDRTVVWHFDITGRKRAEEALRASEGRLRSVIENAPMAIILKDTEGRYALVNNFYENIFNIPADEVRGKTAAEIYPPEAAARLEADDQKVAHSRTVTVTDREIMALDSHAEFVRISKFPVFDQYGEVSGVGTIISDISVEKAAEEQLRQSHRMEAVGQLTGGVAHDFNNILAAIIGNLDLIQDSNSPMEESDKQGIAIALRAALRGAELTDRLLAFSRRQELDAKATDINDLLSDFRLLAERTIGADIAIRMKLATGLWPTMVDAGQLENALLNLAINARDAMPEGGHLIIETANRALKVDETTNFEDLDPGDYVMITVRDSGSGMSRNVQERVFEPFFTTKEIGKGSGLGLSMVFGFARQTGGQVLIDSVEGEGTTVRIYLPRAADVIIVDDVTAEKQDRPKGNETILVVEDNEDLLNYLVKALGQLGYSVLRADTGLAALEVMGGADGIDLLLTDVVLPYGMSGRDVADVFHERYPPAAVLFSSGYTREALNRRGQFDVDVELISKPYQTRDLASRVRQVLDSQ